MKTRSPIQSFRFALNGIIYVVKTQKNMQRSILLSIGILLIGFLLGLTNIELVLLFIPITFLLLAEMFNTTAEVVLDFVNGRAFNWVVKIIKDITAGAVLIALIGLCITATTLFIGHLPQPIEDTIKLFKPYIKIIMPPIVILVCIVTYAISLKKSHRGAEVQMHEK